MYCSHEAVLPPPVSVLSAWRPLQRNHCESGSHASAMLSVVQVSLVPLCGSTRRESVPFSASRCAIYPRAIGVEILVHVEDKVGVAPVGVDDGRKRSRGTVRNKRFRFSVIVTGKEDYLCGGASFTNGGNGSLGIQLGTLRTNHD